jgi:hypothetical protein
MKNCLVCNKEILRVNKYCSKKCYWIDKKGQPSHAVWSNELRNKMSKAYTGKGNPMYGKECWNKGKKRLEITGPKHFAWKGGFWISDDGYKIIENEVETKGYKLLEHRKVMEKFLGRKLLSSELIHHINHNKLDNRINNLQIVTRSEHPKIHAYNKNTEKWLINYYQGL